MGREFQQRAVPDLGDDGREARHVAAAGQELPSPRRKIIMLSETRIGCAPT